MPGWLWLIVKTFFVVTIFLWVRATFPRYRYDQIMRLGWKVFIPVTLVWQDHWIGSYEAPTIWTISGIAAWQSGQPYTAFTSVDLNNDGNARNDRAPGFARNTFRLPSQFSVDPRVTKDIAIFAGARLQLIAEAFNLFNRSNVSGVRNTYYAVATTGGVPSKFTLQDIPTSNPFGLPTLS